MKTETLIYRDLKREAKILFFYDHITQKPSYELYVKYKKVFESFKYKDVEKELKKY